jgi:hypothetical protein
MRTNSQRALRFRRVAQHLDLPLDQRYRRGAVGAAAGAPATRRARRSPVLLVGRDGGVVDTTVEAARACCSSSGHLQMSTWLTSAAAHPQRLARPSQRMSSVPPGSATSLPAAQESPNGDRRTGSRRRVSPTLRFVDPQARFAERCMKPTLTLRETRMRRSGRWAHWRRLDCRHPQQRGLSTRCRSRACPHLEAGAAAPGEPGTPMLTLMRPGETRAITPRAVHAQAARAR